MIIYSKSSHLGDAAIGRLETPIKMVIEHESDLLTKKGGTRDWLFNVEKSNRFAETIVAESEFNMFRATKEGEAAESDTIREAYDKYIEHIQFMKEFAITAEMMEDANYGIAASARRRVENFTRAYYKTMHKLCEHALANATALTSFYLGTTLDLTSPDSTPLFSSYHSYGPSDDEHTQSNYYCGKIFQSGGAPSVGAFEEALSELTVIMRNFKDENGDPLGYTADTIILPGNRPVAESIVKKVCGSERATGSNHNDINIQYGNWNIVVMPTWEAEDDRVMLMSSEANKNLSGNMFFNRVPLTISNWVDHHTGNYIWNGRCRFGLGFGSYKHIMLAVDTATIVDGATPL